MSLDSAGTAPATEEILDSPLDPGARRLCWWRFVTPQPGLAELEPRFPPPAFTGAEDWDRYDEVHEREILAKELEDWRPVRDSVYGCTDPQDLAVRSIPISRFLSYRLSSIADVLIEKAETKATLGIDDPLRQFDERAGRLRTEVVSTWNIWLNDTCSFEDHIRPVDLWTTAIVLEVRQQLIQALISVCHQVGVTGAEAAVVEPIEHEGLPGAIIAAEARSEDPKVKKKLRAVTMYNWYLSELQAVKRECRKYQTPDLLKEQFPQFNIWKAICTDDETEIANGSFVPSTFAWSLVARRLDFRSIDRRTLDNYKKALKNYGLEVSAPPASR